MEERGGPYVLAMVVCERIERQAGGGFSAIGVMDTLGAEADDVDVRIGFHFDVQVGVLFGLASGAASGPHRVRLVAVSPGIPEVVCYEKEWPLVPGATSWQPCQFTITIRRLGLHRFRLFVGDACLGEAGFVVHQLTNQSTLHA